MSTTATRDKKTREDKTSDDKFNVRRAELGEAALTTLAELGYARTSLREIAQNSEFSHGVLHYYFTDKLDLILCSVRQYKARCVKRYDEVTATSESYDELLKGFATALGDTLRNEASLHRLWYDLRAQALFEAAFREDVAEIDKSLEKMIWRVLSRFAELSGRPLQVPSAVAYAMFDGLFQQALLKHLSGDKKAVAALHGHVALVVAQLVGAPVPAVVKAVVKAVAKSGAKALAKAAFAPAAKRGRRTTPAAA